MMDMKRIKDPVYGYIEIPSKLISDIVDTPLFQRLRRVVQTSYCSLYPSASHTRFAHSLGVYFLGDIAASCIEDKSLSQICVDENSSIGLKSDACRQYLNVFRKACLLHDIGHAPFSHTGEEFYSRGEDEESGCECTVDLVDMLQQALSIGDDFKHELSRHKPKSANHEIMSAVIGVEQFDLFNSQSEKEFFARAITGYQFDDKSLKRVINEDGVNLSFLNCLISLLNSSVVDVDRLDYVIRDAKVIGFESVSLDFRRLLGGIRICVYDKACKVVYTKQSVGILENVVFAHDAEKKWIQNHPTIGYEMNLLTRSINEVRNYYSKALFSKAALLEQGLEIAGFRVRLLSDDDLIFLMKNLHSPSEDIQRYFDRSRRERALWKSESDFKALFPSQSWAKNPQVALQVLLSRLVDVLERYSPSGVRINQSTLDFLKKDANDAENLLDDERLNSATRATTHDQKSLLHDFAKVFLEFAKDVGVACDFAIQEGNPFKSGFMKDDLGNTQVQLNVLDEPVSLKDITPVLSRRKEADPLKIFYVFHSRDEHLNETHAVKLVKHIKSFISNHEDEILKNFRVETKELQV